MASNKQLNATITIGGAVAGTLRTAIGSTTGQLKKVGDEINRVKREQKMLSDSIRTFGAMGKNVDNLRARYATTVTQLERITAAQHRLDRAEKARLRNAERYNQLVGQIGATVATAASIGAPIVAAAKFETAMLGIAKQLDGARDENFQLTKTFYDMRKEVQLLGRELPITNNEIAGMVGEALKMGVAKNEVIEFTRVVAEMSTAFELPAQELAESMGKIANMYKIPITEIDNLADSINYLDDNAIAAGKDIIDFMQRVGGTASMVKISSKNTAALGSTLLTLGERSETAATAINAVFSKLGAANTQSKPFREMLAEIGLETHEIGNMMQKDAVGGIFAVMDAIRKLPKESKLVMKPIMNKKGDKIMGYEEAAQTTQIDAVATLFGAEHWDTFSKLLENRKELEKQLAWSTDKAADGSMSREFQARMQTTEAMWATFKNRMNEVAVNIGTVLLPAVNSVVGGIGQMASVLADFSAANPRLTKAVATTVVALGALKVGLLAARLAMVASKSVWLSSAGTLARLQSGAALASGAFGKFLPVLGRIGSVLMRAPILFSGVGVAAVAVGVMIYKYWDRIAAFFSGFWVGLKTGMEPVINSFRELWQSMSWLHPVVTMVGNAVGIVYDWFVKLLSPVKASDEQLKAATSAGESFGRVVGAAVNFVLTPVRLLVDALAWIHKNIGGIIGKVAELANKAPSVGSFIGSVKSSLGFGGGSAPAAPSQAPRSVPAAPSMRGGNTSSFTNAPVNTFHITASPGMDTNQLANDIMNKINQTNAVKQRSSMLDAGYAQ